MENRRPPVPVIIVILLIVIVGGYYGFKSLKPATSSSLNASGSIESTTVNISPEMAGKVKEVLVVDGQLVKAGDPLLSLDDSLLTAQKAVASAQLDSAKAALTTAQSTYDVAQQQYAATLSNALKAEQSSRITIWKDSKPTEFDQPVWYFAKDELLKASQAEVDVKQQALADAKTKLADRESRVGSSQFLTAEAKLVQMRLAFQNAQDVFDATNGASDGQTLRDSAQVTLDDSKIDLNNAQKDYNDALTTDGAKDVLQARSDLIVAQEAYDTAADQLRSLQTGINSEPVVTASKAVDQAKSVLDQAQTGVNTAQANLALLDTQSKKLTVYAPMDGVILVRNVEPGEFVQPGAVALTLADLSNLTITVYVPDPRLNEIKLGQTATVTIDVSSGASPTFNAEVTHIADQAEFTPRNVQTVEGRSSTVYAIKLKVTNKDDMLKIGMPADVVFK